MSITTNATATRKVAAFCGAAVLLLGASACGGGGDNHTAAPQTGEQGGPQTDRQGGTSGRLPGANGKVAAVAGSTAQVQGMDGQVAVTWTDATTFTKEVGASLADVKVGECVLVRSGDQPSSDSTPSTEMTAATVRIVAKTDGSCSSTRRGPGGSDGTGPQTYAGPPPGASGDGGSVGGQPPRIRFGGVVGEVTAVSGSGFSVESVMPGSGDSGTTATVTVDADTTYTTTAKAAASDVEVGVCVAAHGTADQTGAVSADTIAISKPQDGQCGGFVRVPSDAGTNQDS